MNLFTPEWSYKYKGMGVHDIPEWDDVSYNILDPELPAFYCNHLRNLEAEGVFFSSPLDLDFSMISSFKNAYSIKNEDLVHPSEKTVNAVLGDKHGDYSCYSTEQQRLFLSYHKRFKLGSKPAAHLDALTQLSDAELLVKMPESLGRLADAVIAKLKELPE
jgi:hypothetical protein